MRFFFVFGSSNEAGSAHVVFGRRVLSRPPVQHPIGCVPVAVAVLELIAAARGDRDRSHLTMRSSAAASARRMAQHRTGRAVGTQTLELAA